MLTDADRVPLAARAWIADGVRGALVAADGTIDWYCPASFDGPPALWRLLDPGGAAVRVGPVREGTGSGRKLPPGSQRYVGDSLVAETVLRTGTGQAVQVLDALAWAGTSAGRILPAGRVVRVATALAGPVEIEVEVLPGAGSGRVDATSEGVAWGSLVVRAGVDFAPAPLGRNRPRWRGVRRLEPGESLVVTVDDRRSVAPTLSVGAARRLVDDTVVAWQSWLAPLVAAGSPPHRAAMARSALLVRSLTGPAGGPVGAGTTSLPRRAGGERTADDRGVRLRDAAAAAAALARAGLNEDAEAAERWLREAIEGTALPWPASLTPGGDPRPELEELAWVGWRRSQPVVTGTPVGTAPDLDVHGDVALAVSASQRGAWGAGGAGPLTAAALALAAGADWVADHWQEPDGGVWAVSGRPVPLVASTVQAWVALDAAARRAVAAHPLDLPAATWRAEARRVLSWLEAEAVAPDGGPRRSVAGAGGPDGGLRRSVADAGGPDDTDAALLRVAWQGPWPAGHPIVAATVDRILERQSAGGLLHRLSEGVDDGRAGADSPDLLASVWAVRALAHLGRWEEAHQRLDAVLAVAGPTGILASAADPLSRELLGNLPATAVHLALMDAAGDLAAGPR